MSKRKILLADDSETVQKVVNLTFELEGIEVITFGDGDSAMEQMAAVAPDVILADVNMPGMNGYDICQHIKADEATKNTPVILLVGSFEPFDEERAMQVGADDYLTKPFQSIRQLVSKVNELLAPGNSDKAEIDMFAETLEMKKKPYQETEFGDPGMDDEMIQTSQIGSIPADETAKYQTSINFQNDEPDEVAKTQPLSENDFEYIYPNEQNSESQVQTVYELAEEQPESAIEQTEDFASEVKIEDQNVEESVSQFSKEEDFQPESEEFSADTNPESFENQEPEEIKSEFQTDDDFGIQPDDIDHFYKEPDYDDDEEETGELPQLLDESEQVRFKEPPQISETETNAENEKEFSAYENVENEEEVSDTTFTESFETESAEEFATNAEQSQISSPVPILDFDELDLLEISSPEKQSANTVESAFEIETSLAGSHFVEESAENETEQVKTEVAEQLSGINLSAADIDAIAEKVVEKLTARMKE